MTYHIEPIPRSLMAASVAADALPGRPDEPQRDAVRRRARTNARPGKTGRATQARWAGGSPQELPSPHNPTTPLDPFARWVSAPTAQKIAFLARGAAGTPRLRSGQAPTRRAKWRCSNNASLTFRAAESGYCGTPRARGRPGASGGRGASRPRRLHHGSGRSTPRSRG